MPQTLWKVLTVCTALWLAVLTAHVTMQERPGHPASHALVDEAVVGWRNAGDLHVVVFDPGVPGALGAGFRVRGEELASLMVGTPESFAELRAEPSGSRLTLVNGKAKIVAGFEGGIPVITGYGPDGKEAWREPRR